MSMMDAGSCFECGKEVDMENSPADPNGNPLCKDCFSVLVRAGKSIGDTDELV